MKLIHDVKHSAKRLVASGDTLEQHTYGRSRLVSASNATQTPCDGDVIYHYTVLRSTSRDGPELSAAFVNWIETRYGYTLKACNVEPKGKAEFLRRPPAARAAFRECAQTTSITVSFSLLTGQWSLTRVGDPKCP